MSDIKTIIQEHIPNPWIEERRKKGPHQIDTEKVGFNGTLAVFMSKKFGSMSAFYVLLIWMLGWIVLATLGVGFFKNDQYPFTFLLFLSNLVQLLALPILAVGQQVLSRASDKQALQTFKDAEVILKLQDEIHKLIKINNVLTEDIHSVLVAKKQ